MSNNSFGKSFQSFDARYAKVLTEETVVLIYDYYLICCKHASSIPMGNCNVTLIYVRYV